MQLSPNFSLAEFTASATATAQGIANVPGSRQSYTRGQPNSGWIHVSYRDGRLRKDVLTYSRRAYFKGLLA